MKLPALSLRQPWAWLVLHGGKTIENRTWGTRFRGLFLLHAAQGMTREEYQAAYDFAVPRMAAGRGQDMPVRSEYPRGGIVGTAYLDHILSPEEYPGETTWRFPHQYGYQLSRIEPLPFLKCPGFHKFWSTDRLREQHPEWPGWEIVAAREKIQGRSGPTDQLIGVTRPQKVKAAK